MELQSCSHCGIRVVPKQDGTCPRCGHSLESAATPGSEVESRDAPPAVNPYAPPNTAAFDQEPSAGPKAKEPFSHQAAKFSAYAPFVLFLMGCCIREQADALRGTESGTQLGLFLGGLSLLITLAAVALGIIGLVGGIRRSATRTVVFAIVGLLLNCGLIALWTVAILLLANLSP